MKKLTNNQIIFGAGVALSILLIVIVLGYKSISESQRNSEWVTHTLSAIAGIQKIESSLNFLSMIGSKIINVLKLSNFPCPISIFFFWLTHMDFVTSM